MKATLRLLLAGAALALSAAVAAAALNTIGKPAPDFVLTDLAGKPHTLSDYRGKVVVLEWVNPECPFVRKHYEGSRNLPETQRAATADGVVWLSINSGREGAQGDFSAEEVAEWKRRTGAAPTAYLRDPAGKVGRLYDARHTPTLFVINPEGLLVYAGAIDSINSANPADIAKATNYVSTALADLKAGRAVAQPVTRAYGCGIKY